MGGQSGLESRYDCTGKEQKDLANVVLKLLYANVSERFIVTGYHPNGTLDKLLHRFMGDVLAAPAAFRALVDAIVDIQTGRGIESTCATRFTRMHFSRRFAWRTWNRTTEPLPSIPMESS